MVIIERPLNFDSDDYEDCTVGGDVVHRVVESFKRGQDVIYTVEFMDMHKERVSFHSYFIVDVLVFSYCSLVTSLVSLHTMCPSSLF